MAKRRMLLIIAGMLGAGCTHVAKILAEKLKVDYVNTEKLLRQIVVDRGVPYAQFATLVHSGEVDLEMLMRSMLLDYVHEGNVIIEGRSGLLILDQPADLKVFLWAPEDYRAKAVAQRRNISYEEALDAVRASDEERAALVRRLFKKDWLDIELYDLVINTAKWSYEQTANLIEAALKTRKGE